MTREPLPNSCMSFVEARTNVATNKLFYFGRGSSTCIGVELRAGHYAHVFLGSGKTGERSRETMLLDRRDLHKLAMFFLALWQEHGQEIFVAQIHDDPIDEILMHDFDFTQNEVPGT